MLKKLVPRLYQETIFSTCVNNNTLVVLPTGMGKTALALMLAGQRLKQHPNSKIVLLAPTKPLAEQHMRTFKEHLDIDEDKLVLFTGHTRPEKRALLWKEKQIIFSTPQGLENDILSNKIDITGVSLFVFDEAHRAVGDYSYVFVAKKYHRKAKYPKILALTASPGSDLEKITEVCQNLFIESVEIRTDRDPDVKPYIQETSVNWVKVVLPEEFLVVKKYLENCMKTKLNEIKKHGYVHTINIKNKTDLLKLQRGLHAKISQGEKDFEILKSLSLVAETIKAHHALELLESQGVSALNKYLEKLQIESVNSKVKAVKNLVKDLNFRSAVIKTRKLIDDKIEHPKLKELMRIVSGKTVEKDIKIIIFTQFRDSATKIKEVLAENPAITSKIFVGQAKRGETGLSQKEQIKMLQEFRDGEFNTLIATSVAEEGLDIPKVDCVIFYEPIPSAIRSIQRRGRTGRSDKGSVIVLLAKDTRDEGYRWSAFHKEKRMYRLLDQLRNRMDFQQNKQKENTLDKYLPENEKIKIYADYREKGSGVLKELDALGIRLSLEKLQSADFLLSGRVGVEYKTSDDFVTSIIDGRLLAQLKELKKNFERPIIIVEGEQDIFSVRKVHPNAIRGMLATIAVSYGIPVIQTKSFIETAHMLKVIAKREQEQNDYKDFSPHSGKKVATLKDQQEYFISSLPNIGMAAAKDILKKFGSVKSIVNASEDQLKEVEKIGDKKAKDMKNVFDGEYDK